MKMKDNMFIAGRTHSGKTYDIQNVIIPGLLSDDKRQIVIIDHKNEYNKGVSIDINLIPNLKTFHAINSGKYTKKKIPEIIIVKALDFDPDDITMIYKYLCLTRNKILIHDEVSFYYEDLKTGKIPIWTKKFIRAATMEHNNNHNAIFCSQSPQDVPKTVYGQFQTGKIFKLNNTQLDYLHKSKFLANKPEYYKFNKPYQYYSIPEDEEKNESET